MARQVKRNGESLTPLRLTFYAYLLKVVKMCENLARLELAQFGLGAGDLLGLGLSVVDHTDLANANQQRQEIED